MSIITKPIILLKKWKFEIILVFSVIVIIILGLYNNIKGNKGSWTDKFYISNTISTHNKNHNKYYNNKYYNNKYRKPVVLNAAVYVPDWVHISKNDSKGEVECRKIMERIFNKPFKKARPDFLKNPVTGNNFNLELDCYNSELKIAVEYNGAQHYKYIPYFHKNKEAFLNQKYRDDMKRRICQEQGILLIEVPYTVAINQIADYLIKELEKNKKI